VKSCYKNSVLRNKTQDLLYEIKEMLETPLRTCADLSVDAMCSTREAQYVKSNKCLIYVVLELVLIHAYN